jgi:antitoxin YefM
MALAQQDRQSMKQIPRTEFRAIWVSTWTVCESRAPLYVTRQNGPSIVILAAEEYDGLMETLHLRRHPANAAGLLDSIAKADAGLFVEREII